MAEQWHEEFEQLVTAGRPSPTTANQTATPLTATRTRSQRDRPAPVEDRAVVAQGAPLRKWSRRGDSNPHHLCLAGHFSTLRESGETRCAVVDLADLAA